MHVIGLFLQLALTLVCRAPAPGAQVPLWSGTLAGSEHAAEFRVQLRARTPGASWEDARRACGVLTVSIDERYEQHVFLAGNGEWAGYEFIVGPVAPGLHAIRLDWMRDWTPDLAQAPELRDVRLEPLRQDDPALEPVLRAPSIWLRADTIGRFSDVPLALYWERLKAPPGERLVYTLIMTNEDGGTNTERLMARWGRTSDIEWCYAHAGAGDAREDSYQGRDHETLAFRGRYDGWHPNLYDVTLNNIFSDAPSGAAQTVRVRPLPVFADLARSTRESVMERFPWLYAVMAAEMEREGKIESPGDPATAAVSDLRNYAYVELCAEQRGTELRFEVQLTHSERWFSSDHLDPKARIERSGCVRSSVELPPGTRPGQIGALRVECLPEPTREGGLPGPPPPGAGPERRAPVHARPHLPAGAERARTAPAGFAEAGQVAHGADAPNALKHPLGWPAAGGARPAAGFRLSEPSA